MSDSTYISFPELFKTEESGIRNVVIPKIQRAYAQGREDDHAKSVRNSFLQAIHKALESGKGMTLDFIYGNCQNGNLIPLDGQQRLTTLFLLHWYVAKRERRNPDDWDFLKHFTYETRYSARDFCKKLVEFTPSFQYSNSSISEEIKDQVWFPMDWMHDSTVASMLVMLDAIEKEFAALDNLWEKLGSIKFYFRKLEDMNLTDDIYIKMNSRGKPLTDFENFKAEMEKTLKKNVPERADEIAHKIDTVWTDLLWLFAIDDDPTDELPSTDEAFLRYFRFVCDILCYRSNESPKTSDVFKLLDIYFTKENAKANAETLCAFFDCWLTTGLTGYGKNIDGFFDSFLCEKHEEDKVQLPKNYSINLFKDCVNDYSKIQSNGNRKFPLNKIILLYAAVIYIQNNSTIAAVDFKRRYRIVNNLVLNSEYEISDSENRVGGNRMPAILKQVDSIILNGVISENIEIGDSTKCINFNLTQLNEEREKQLFLSEHPEFTRALYELEDHPLLTGQIGIIGLEHTENFKKFELLFECDWDLVDCALFSMGDYSQRDNSWRIQVGTSNRNLPKPWENLFHQGSANNHFDKTKGCLRMLLAELGQDVSDTHLSTIINHYLEQAESAHRLDWIYYYVKYPSFRLGRYGKYEQSEETPYHITGIHAESRISSNSYELFLNEMDDRCEFIDNDTTRIEDVFVRNNNSSIEIYNETGTVLKEIPVQQENNIDVVNRIELGRTALAKFSTVANP